MNGQMEIYWEDAIEGPERSYSIFVQVAYAIESDPGGGQGECEIKRVTIGAANVYGKQGFIGHMEQLSPRFCRLFRDRFDRAYPHVDLVDMCRNHAVEL